MNNIQTFESRYSKVLHVLFLLVLLTGLSLRAYQYLMGRSLWEDEAHLALNFMSRDYAGLLQPLDYIQAGPVLFLWTVKTFALLFGYGPCALRALPFLANMLTLPLFYYILKAFVPGRIAALIGFFTFSVNLAVIYFSSELKTYGLDVAVYLLLVYLVVSQHSFVRSRRNVLLALAGCLSLLYSNLTFIFLFCIAVYMLMGWIREKKMKRDEAGVLLAWAIVFAANYLLFIQGHPHAAIQKENYLFAFPPLPLSGEAFSSFMKQCIEETGFTLLLYVSKAWDFAYMLLFILLAGLAYAVYKKQYTLLLLTCLPVLLHFTLALFKIYPFWYRFLLYMVPILILLMSLGLYVIMAFLMGWTKPVAVIMFGLVCCGFFTAPSLRQFPLWFREIRPVLDKMNTIYSGYPVFVTTPYTLYKYHIRTGYVKDTAFEGLAWHISPEQYDRQMEGLRSKYVLLHATDPAVDGYGDVMKHLEDRNLILSSFSYGSYTISEIAPVPLDSGMTFIDYHSFPADKVYDLSGEKVVAIWSFDATSRPVPLKKGKYKLEIAANGTPAKGTFPHLKVLVNHDTLLQFYTGADVSSSEVIYEQIEDGDIVLRILMDNDVIDEAAKEDRNAFVRRIKLLPQN